MYQSKQIEGYNTWYQDKLFIDYESKEYNAELPLEYRKAIIKATAPVLLCTIKDYSYEKDDRQRTF